MYWSVIFIFLFCLKKGEFFNLLENYLMGWDEDLKFWNLVWIKCD